MHGHGGGFAHGGAHGGHVAGRLGEYLDEDALGKPFDLKVVRRLFGYMAPYKTSTFVGMASVIVATLTSIAVPWLVKLGVDDITQRDLHGLDMVVLAFTAIAVVGWIAQYVQLIVMAKVSQGVLYTLRTQLFDHLQRLSLSFYDRNEAGRVMSRVQNDVQTLQDFLNSSVLSIADLFSLVGVVIALFALDWKLASICMAVLPVLIIIMALWQRRARTAFVRVRQAIAVVNAGLQENISGIRVIQSMNREDENMRRFSNVNEAHMNANLQAGRLSAFLMPVVEMLMAVAIALVIVVGGSRVLGGEMQVGVLVAFALYIQRFFDPIRNLTMTYTELQRAMASGIRIFELLDTKAEVVDAPGARELPPVHGEVRFEHVSFSYVPGIEVLHDMDLAVAAGESIALVGPTGAGKSTVVALLARFYDVKQGRITIDERDIRDVTRESLSRQVGMVLQDPFLFSGTVGENIRYGRLEASDEEVMEAAKTVGAHDFIMRLEKGYSTPLQERGGNLSVGQRQLVSFARAVLANPRILILDEATANIDTHTELLIQQALEKLLKGRTSFVIAHRLSTVRDASRVVVIDGGRIVEEGAPQELLAQGGLYTRLYTMNYRLDTERTGAGA